MVKDEENKKKYEKIEDDKFVTRDDFNKIIDGFEGDMESFDKRTREQTQRLEEVEDLINEVPEQLGRIEKVISDINKKHFTNYHKLSNLINEKNYIGKFKSILIITTLIALIILFYLLYQ